MSADTVFALLQPGRVLDPRYRELAILRTAIVGDCKFEYSQHLKVARLVGVSEEQLQAIKGWTTSDTFDPAERAVMAAVDELLSRNLVEDATFAALKRHFNDEQIVELFFVVCTYRMHGMFIRALQLEYDTDTTAHVGGSCARRGGEKSLRASDQHDRAQVVRFPRLARRAKKVRTAPVPLRA